MPRHFTLHFTCVCVLLLTCSLASANVSVGDTPKLKFQPFGARNTSLSLADYKGKLVIVDFWATWCGPCMQEAGHMVDTYNKYHSKGLEYIGISLDEDPSALTNIIKEKNFTWPQFYDGRGWKNEFAVAWGVESIPQTFLISPTGEVLWRGHPAELDEPLAKAFKEHPPQLVDAITLADATTDLDAAQSAMKDEKFGDAFAALAKVPESAKQDPKIAKRVGNIQEKLETRAQKMLDEVDPLIASGKFADAATRLHQIADSLGDTPLGTQAKQKLGEMLKNPDAKADVDAAAKIKQADDALAGAQKLQVDKNDDGAYIAFKSIVKNYPGTNAAKSAADAAATYEKDPAFVKRANEKAFGARAKSMLSLADNYRNAGRPELAQKKYQDVIDQFPNTSYADTAKKALAEMK